MSLPEEVHWSNRQLLEEQTAATIRALTELASVHFEAGRPWAGDAQLPDLAPHLQPQSGMQDISDYRGLADGLALRILYSDQEYFLNCVADCEPVQALIFDWLEQLRTESLAPDRWPGMKANLKSRFDRWNVLFLGSELDETESGRLLLCFAHLVRSRILGERIDLDMEDYLELTRAKLGPPLAKPLKELRQNHKNQYKFAPIALELAKEFSHLLLALKEIDPSPPKPQRTSFAVAVEGDESQETARAGFWGAKQQESSKYVPYSVWTRIYDQVLKPMDVVRHALLLEYREKLDKVLLNGAWAPTRLASKLRQVLQEQIQDDWVFGTEEGYVDGRRLSQLVSSPDRHSIFFQPSARTVIKAQLSVLIDCSGSMRHHGLQIALFMDLLNRACERAEVPLELLGFTTGAWNGGRPARDFSRAVHKPDVPGRLNEVNHYIFHDSSIPRNLTRLSICSVMKPDLFREALDGEAVQWACDRLRANETEGRKILWVLSDGAPADSATKLANPPGYLDNHLRNVVHQNIQEGGIEILGIGVGRDMSEYYPRSSFIDFEHGLDMHDMLGLIQTLSPHR